jgi:hypothetical protein
VYATGLSLPAKPPAGAYQGCWTDDPARALPVALMPSGATVETCVAAARTLGYAYAGLQFEGQCWAGDTIGHAKVADSQCSTPCTANKSQICGGGWRSSVYSTR